MKTTTQHRSTSVNNFSGTVGGAVPVQVPSGKMGRKGYLVRVFLPYLHYAGRVFPLHVGQIESDAGVVYYTCVQVFVRVRVCDSYYHRLLSKW